MMARRLFVSHQIGALRICMAGGDSVLNLKPWIQSPRQEISGGFLERDVVLSWVNNHDILSFPASQGRTSLV